MNTRQEKKPMKIIGTTIDCDDENMLANFYLDTYHPLHNW